MREPKKVIVNEIEYVITPMGPIKATKVLTRLLKIIGKPLAKMMSDQKTAPGGSILDAELGEGLIGEAIEALTERLDEDKVEKLIQDLASAEHVSHEIEGGKYKKLMSIDGHFGQFDNGLMGMFVLLKNILEVNYADFFGGLGELKK